MKRVCATLALMLTMTGPLWAERVELGEEDVFYLDTDGDGAISGAEYAAFAYFAFRRMDTNNSGTLSAREVSAYLPPDDFATLDKDGDGRVTKPEYAQHLNADFAAADQNGDGVLD